MSFLDIQYIKWEQQYLPVVAGEKMNSVWLQVDLAENPPLKNGGSPILCVKKKH